MTCQNSLNLQTASIEAAARETQTLQAKASEAQRAAVAAQRKTKSALEMIDSLKGQSCAGVVNELWGRI